MVMAERQHIAWVDGLRVLACFMVVLAHACDSFVGQFDTNRAAFIAGVSIGSLMRASVPLFVMMTAVVHMPSLQRRDNLSLAPFYRKRIGRLVLPLVFWSLALPVMMWGYTQYINPSSANAIIDAAGYTPSAMWTKLTTWVFNFNFDTTPLWYLYMLVGLYLVMPIVFSWLHRASRQDVRVFLLVWVISMMMPWLRLFAPLLGYEGNYGHMGIWGECDWNPFGLFYYVSGFVGYLVLAYYLITWPLRLSRRKLTAIFLPVFLVGYAVTFAGFLMIQNYYPGDYAYLEMIWYFCGINVLMMTLPIFLFASRFIADARLGLSGRKMLSYLASLTFGIYLCHFPFEFVAYDLLDIPSLAPWLRIIAGSLITFAAAAVLTALFRAVPGLRRLIA